MKAKQDVEEKKRLLEKKRKEHDNLNQTLDTLLPLVKEGNISAEELIRKIEFEPTIVHEVDEKPGQSPLDELKNSKSVVKVRVNNKEDGYHYLWDPEKFTNRLYMIRDVMDEYFETGKVPKIDKDEDPFWDPQEAILIGRSYLYLKSLGYMLNNPTACKIMNTNATSDLGTLECDVQPTDETGDADDCPEELMVEEPNELLGKRIDFNIMVKKANNLPEMLCKDTYVKYGWYLENGEYRTETIEGINRSPDFGYKHHMTVDCVTEDILKYFENDALTFKVYGTPTNEKFRKQLTIEDDKKSTTKKAATKTADATKKGRTLIKKSDGEVEIAKKSGWCTIF